MALSKWAGWSRKSKFGGNVLARDSGNQSWVSYLAARIFGPFYSRLGFSIGNKDEIPSSVPGLLAISCKSAVVGAVVAAVLLSVNHQIIGVSVAQGPFFKGVEVSSPLWADFDSPPSILGVVFASGSVTSGYHSRPDASQTLVHHADLNSLLSHSRSGIVGMTAILPKFDLARKSVGDWLSTKQAGWHTPVFYHTTCRSELKGGKV